MVVTLTCGFLLTQPLFWLSSQEGVYDYSAWSITPTKTLHAALAMPWFVAYLPW